jgi:hypothetical protein
MLEVFGPTYKYNGEILTTPQIIYVNDHHYNEEDQCFHVKQLLENSTCNPKDHILVFDHVNHEDALTDYHCLSLPIFLAAECEEFRKQEIEIDWDHKTRNFNFMINKPRRHREFLLILIEHFKLTNYAHSLAWTNTNLSRTTLTNSTNNPNYKQILDTVEIKIPTTSYKFGPEVTMEKGIRNGNFKNAETYQHLLQKNVFEPSCISLITEPAFYERETIHTEKTIMAMYSGTLPIWFGGWRLADYMESMGFDVFHDIVDHSYQDLPDPMDRCYYAIEHNLDLLKDLDRAREFIKNNRSRFEHNVKLLKENVFLTDCFNKVEQYQGSVRDALMSIIPQYRGNMFKNFRTLKDYHLLGQYNAGAVHKKEF